MRVTPSGSVTQSLLIYDGSRAPFRAAADLVGRVASDLKPVRWQADHVQAFLDAQFDDRPFAFILVEDDTVAVGEDAIGRLLQRRGVDDTLANLVTRAYPPFSAPFGRVVHGREPADLHGTFPLTDAARDHLDTLRQRHTIPVSDG